MSLSSAEISVELLDAFVRLSRGDLSVRLKRTYTRDSQDTLAHSFNLMAEELGRLLAESEANRQRLADGVAELNELFLRVAAGDFSARAARTESGDPLDVLGFLFDNMASELGEIFAESERQRSALQATFDSIADAVFLIDGSGHIERANEAASRLFGRSVRYLEGSPFASLLAPTERELLDRLGQGGTFEPFRARDTRFVDPGGNPFTLVLSGAPVTANPDGSGAAVLTARDDRELRTAQAQLQLADRMATMGTLAAGVAHEINNPLSFVLSNLEFVLEELEHLGPGRAPTPELIEEITQALSTSRDGAERVARIVRDLKSISRVDDDAVADVDLSRVLDSATAMLRNEIRHRARLVKSYGEAPLVRANEARLVQVALNLLQNAAQAIPPGHAAEHQVRVETSVSDDGEAVLTIADTGSGIPPENIKSIFDTFFTTKPVGVGTGLGLSICQRLVSQLGGRIEVDSVLGRGSVFRVFLPGLAEPTLTGIKAVTPAEVGAPKRRILVVDDEREIGESVRRLLGSEHQVDIAVGGTEALRLFANHRYDLVLIDLLMPEMSGRELRKALKAKYPGHPAQLVLMTGGSVTGSEKTSETFLEKPFTPKTLRDLVAQLHD